MASNLRVLFIGSKKLGLAALRVLYKAVSGDLLGVLTVDDRSDTRSAFDEIREFSVQRGIPFHVAGNRKSAAETIRLLNPDLCLVVGWYWLIDNATLAVAKRGFIGLHNSLLPAYRGGSPLVWSIMNGDKRVGATLFSFTEGMDDGDVWGYADIKVGPDDTIGEVLERLETKCVKWLNKILPAILDGTVKPRPQLSKFSSYCAQRLPSDGEVDWTRPANAVYDAIRAQGRPYPGAFTRWNGKKLIIWRAGRFDFRYFGVPGQVARVSQEGVLVICGDRRAVVLKQIEYDQRICNAQDVLTSVKIRLASEARARSES